MLFVETEVSWACIFGVDIQVAIFGELYYIGSMIFRGETLLF